MVGIDVNVERAGRRPGKRLAIASLVVALSFCAICGKVLLDARRAALDRAGEVARGLVATIESEIARNIESYNLSLGAVIEGLAFPEILTVSPELRQHILFDRSATAKHLHAITYLDQDGIVRLDSRTPYPKPVDRSDTDFFQFQKHSTSGESYISKPFVTSRTKMHVISVARRVVNPDGTFAGVVAGTIRLSYFSELFKQAALGPNDNITLSRTDGTLLMRWPGNDALIGKNFGHAELFRRLPHATSGRFETKAAVDGVQRLIVYRKIGDLPMVIGVGQATADIYGPWQRYATAIGLMMIVLCGISITFALYLAREMQRRTEAETVLETLAATDGLTGVSNRRAFNAAIEREWRRAGRTASPLSLLMIDTDHFNRYNDLYGHQAGDSLLQAIGSAMLVSIRRGTDVAARYGGDEFAVLLPDTTEFGALQVARYLRERFSDACDDLEIAHSGLSIGVASFAPKPHQPLSALIEAADEALYRAKGRGRNRTEVAEPEPQHAAAA